MRVTHLRRGAGTPRREKVGSHVPHTDDLIFGHGHTRGIVAIEPDPATGTAALYRRVGSATERNVVPLQNWLLARKPQPASIELAGRHVLRHLMLGSDPKAIADRARALAPDQRLAYLDPITAHLVASGDTMYKGLHFSQLRRLQFDIETLDVIPERDDGQIVVIAITDDSGFERVLGLDEFPNEGALIEEFINIVRARDPDIIEGHNVFNFDLWYVNERAKRHGVTVALGRDGTTPMWLDESIRRSTMSGMAVRYYRIEGRQIVDTFIGAVRWDVGRRLPNYKLKHIVRHLGIGDDERTLVDAANMRALWADPQMRAKIKAYCLDDARDTGRLSALVTPNEVYQAQMVPETLQGIACVGIGSRIERLMVRAYLRERASIPRPRPMAPIEGAFSEAFLTGVFHDVMKCDVESLYPSLMLARGIAPWDDDLGVFLPMLAGLRDMRIAVKRDAERAGHDGRRDDLLAADGLQNAFKILINSFFGFLGTNGLHFNDPVAAGRVTEAGREVMSRIVAGLRDRGCTVIEADTDGAYFVAGNGTPDAVVDAVAQTLGDGLHLVAEERYPAMLSLKAKNYVLKRASGDLVMRGSALRSSRDEPFGRALVQSIAALLIEGREGEIAQLVRNTVDKIHERKFSPEEIAHRESITAKTFNASANRRLAAALAERGLAVGDKVRVYQRVGGELALLDEYARDEDRDYLVRRVADFVARFGDLVPPDARIAAGEDRDQLSFL
jgi:DNA polymerase, archaea type